MIKAYNLPYTPPSLILFAYLLAVIVLSYIGIDGIARLSFMVFFPIVLGIAAILIFSYPIFDFNYLFPLGGYGIGQTISQGMFRSSAYNEVVILAIIINSVKSLKINIECDLGAIQGRESYEKLDKINDLNKQIEKYIENGITKTIEKTQKEWGTDIFGFGGYIARSFYTVTEFEKYNWLSHYRDAKVNVDVTVNVRRTGRLMSSSPVRTTKDTIITDRER